MKVEITLLYDPLCPNADLARDNIRQALAELSLPAKWKEADISKPRVRKHLKVSGSPTVLVNGLDVSDAPPDSQAACCRLYASKGGGFLGAPSVNVIIDAIEAARQKRSDRRRLSWLWVPLASLPGGLASLLPVAACPLCLPAYAGFLSAVGLGFLLQARYLLPLMVTFLILALLALAYRAHRRRSYAPLVVGAVASAAIVVGRFILVFDGVVYFGVALLIVASIWNAIPRKATHTATCSSCAPTDKIASTRDG